MQGHGKRLPDVQPATLPLLQPVVLLRRVLRHLRRRSAHQEPRVRQRQRGRPRVHRNPPGGGILQRARMSRVVGVGRVGLVQSVVRRRVHDQDQDLRQWQRRYDGVYGRHVPDPAMRQQTLWLVVEFLY